MSFVLTQHIEQSLQIDIAEALRSLLRNSEQQLLLELLPEYYDGSLSAHQIVTPSDLSRERDVPRIAVDLLPLGVVQPPSACAALATSCDACTLLPHCGWCEASKRCVDGTRSAPLGGEVACRAYEYFTCPVNDEKVVIGAENERSCVVQQFDAHAAPSEVGSPHTPLGDDRLSLLLTFDVRALRTAISGSGGARRIAKGVVQLRARFDSASATPSSTTFANAVWLVGAAANVCAGNSSTSTSTATSAVVMARSPLRYAPASVPPSDVPVTSIDVSIDALASALVSDHLQLRITLDRPARVWSPTTLNDIERRSPLLVVTLLRSSSLLPDACAPLNRTACLATSAASCGWCVDSARCVSGSAFTPYDPSDCALASYRYVDKRDEELTSGVTWQMSLVDRSRNDEPWPNMLSLANAVDVQFAVPSTLLSRSLVRATFRCRFVHAQLRDGKFAYDAELSKLYARNVSVVATSRDDLSTRYDSAPLAVSYVRADDAFDVDVTTPLRVAADSATSRRFVVRLRVDDDVDVRIHTELETANRRRAPSLSIVVAAGRGDAIDVANAPCVIHTSCSSCVTSRQEACGWCIDSAAGSGSCVAGTPQRALFGRVCAAWSYGACLAPGDVALYVPIACGNVAQLVADRAPLDALYVSPRATVLPQSQLSLSLAHQVLTIDLAALRSTAGGALALLAPITLRLFAASGELAGDVLAWSFSSTGAPLNVSSVDCAAAPSILNDERTAIARTTLGGRALHDPIDLDMSAAFAGLTAATKYVRIVVAVVGVPPSSSTLELVAPANCARARLRPMLLARSSSLSRAAIARQRTIVDQCVDGGVYDDNATVSSSSSSMSTTQRRAISIGVEEQWRAGDAMARRQQQSVDALRADLRASSLLLLPRVVDIASLAFTASNATLFVVLRAPSIGRCDLVRVSSSLNVTVAPIRIALAIDDDETFDDGVARNVEVVRAAALVGAVPSSIIVDAFFIDEQQSACRYVTASASIATVNGSVSLVVRLTLDRYAGAVRFADDQRVTLRNGDQFVTLFGSRFRSPGGGVVETISPTCHFRAVSSTITTNATVLNDTAIVCGPLPELFADDVGGGGSIAVSWNGGRCMTASSVPLDVIASQICDMNCNGHGQCRSARCVCDEPYRGATCERVGQEPTLLAVPNATLDDGASYSVRLYLTNDSSATTLLPVSLPVGATLDSANRIVQWRHAVGRATPYEFIVRASNDDGSTALAWFVTVRRSIVLRLELADNSTARSLLLPVGDRVDLRIVSVPPIDGLLVSLAAAAPSINDDW